MKGVTPRLPCVCLTIQDTGSGIKERHLASIFDPFFTTKSKGSGLGLYNARIAVEKHQGAISVQSKEGAGTSFQVWLPQADFSESSQDRCGSAAEARRRAGAFCCWGKRARCWTKRRNSCVRTIITSSWPRRPESLPELLQSSDYQFAGVMLLAEPNAPGLNSLLAEVRQQTKEMKVVLKLAGCSQDELDSQMIKGVDLLLNSDLSQADILGKLESFLN